MDQCSLTLLQDEADRKDKSKLGSATNYGCNVLVRHTQTDAGQTDAASTV